MTATLWLTAAAVVALLAVSFFFAGSETALTATSRARIVQLAKDGNRRAMTVDRLLNEREQFIGAVLLGNNAVNIAASSLATGALLAIFGNAGMLYATIGMTIVVVLFSEVLPKTIAIGSPDRVALAVAPVVQVFVRLLSPITMAMEWIVQMILRPFGTAISQGQSILSPQEELRGAVDLLHREGGVVKAERDMLGGLLDLPDLEVSDVMVHRTKMASIDLGQPAERLVREVLDSPYSRLPLWQDKPENIVGILHGKDLVRALAAVGGDVHRIDVASLARPPWFVPDTTPLSAQLTAFRRRKTHFALVVDEYGEVMGLVTLEDIIEEIVGDITDEYDLVLAGVRPLPDGSVNVEGGIPVRDLNRAMDWHLPDDIATTIAGLVIHEAGTIPEAGQAFTFHGFRFDVLRKQKNRITALRISPLAKAAAG
ncbi:MAG TPA: HlyC/CorC family transporter [Hyphomicrobiales bacterium]|nr:HlyC/CorC family transporter [Hyphomicrobiales bacterium]